MTPDDKALIDKYKGSDDVEIEDGLEEEANNNNEAGGGNGRPE